MRNNDIRFYDFQFNLLYILPPSKYTAVNASIQFADTGTIEITFFDSDLKRIVVSHGDDLLMIWNDFQGYITSYMFTETVNKIFGKHLNGLLQRAVIPSFEETESRKAGYILNQYVISQIPWLEPQAGLNNIGNAIDAYSVEKYSQADKIVQEITEQAKSGYLIKADIPNKKFIFNYLDRTENNLMLSVGNLNIYEPELKYQNADLAFGGWYEKKNDDDTTAWTYISNAAKTGVYKIDVVLSADNEPDAKKELNEHIAEYEINAKTKTLFHSVDYNIGDVIRIQIDGVTEKRLISGVNLWNEQSYGEEPTLTEI